MKGKSKSKSTAVRKGRRGYKKSSAGLSVAGVKQIVNAQIARNLEDYNVQSTSYFTFGNYVNNNLLSYKILTPSTYIIQQGVGSADRRGNQIRIKKVLLRYLINPLPYNAVGNPTPQPQEVMILFGNLKGNQRTVPSTSTINVLYQNGNAASPPTGNCTDLLKPINTDQWNIKKKIIHKIGCAAYNGSGANAINQGFTNNDFSYNIRKVLDITKMFPKTIKFNDTDANPTTDGLYMMIEAVNADNTTAASTTLSMAMEYWLDVYFEDA